MQSTLKNMIIVLVTITFVSALAVGAIYQATKNPIAQAKAAKTVGALAQVLPAFDNDPVSTLQVVEADGGVVKIYTAKNGNEIAGYAVETFTKKGFSGQIRLMVGFNPNGDIFKIEVLEHAETPGLGDKIENAKSDFSAQFTGKNPADFKLAVKKDGGDIDAITASTISSRAYADAVDRAYKVMQSNKTKDAK